MGIDEIVGKYKGAGMPKGRRSSYAVPVLDDGCKRLVHYRRLPGGGYDALWHVYDPDEFVRRPENKKLPVDACALFDSVMKEVDEDIRKDVGYSILGDGPE